MRLVKNNYLLIFLIAENYTEIITKFIGINTNAQEKIAFSTKIRTSNWIWRRSFNIRGRIKTMDIFNVSA